MNTQRLIELLEDSGCTVESYSGRGMYGKRCVSVELQNDADLWKLALELGQSGEIIPPPKIDSLGCGIVAYWPCFAWTDENENNS